MQDPNSKPQAPPSNGEELSQREKLCRLRLIRTEGIGPVLFRKLLDRYDTADRALAALPQLAAKSRRKSGLVPPSSESVEREWEALRRMGGDFLFLGEPDYPCLLAQTPDASPVLSVLGNRARLGGRMLAVVGARNASANGRGLACRFAAEAAAQGYGIVSGMARGIDGAAHTAVLEAGEKQVAGTVAVLAGGLDDIYPQEHEPLYRRLAEEGAILSEMPLGAKTQARHFPRRNRIISGLSLGILVVEAALKSGSLITARYAAEQGREVFAIPGSPLDPRCRGTNDLIRKGAHLVEVVEDVLEVLDRISSPFLPPQDAAAPEALSLFADSGTAETMRRSEPENILSVPLEDSPGLRQKVVEALGPAPLRTDDLIRTLNLPVQQVQNILLELELAGCLQRHPGGMVSLMRA